jgi:hypothetical protein
MFELFKSFLLFCLNFIKKDPFLFFLYVGASFSLVWLFYSQLLEVNMVSDNLDLGRHLENGRQLVQGNISVLYRNVYSMFHFDFPFVNHHWFFGVILFSVYSIFDIPGLVVFKAIVITLSCYLSIKTAIYRSGSKKIVFSLVPVSAILLTSRAGIRPEMISLLFVSWFMWVLFGQETKGIIQKLGPKEGTVDIEHGKNYKYGQFLRNWNQACQDWYNGFVGLRFPRYFWTLPFIQLIWTNTHIYFFLGPLIFYTWVFIEMGYIGDVRSKNKTGSVRFGSLFSRFRIVFFSLAVIFFICLINPNGIKGAFYPLLIFLNHSMPGADNMSPLFKSFMGNPRHYSFLCVFFLSTILFVLNLKRRNLSINIWLIFSIGFVLLGIRNTSLYIVMIFPFFCESMTYVGCSFLGHRVKIKHLLHLESFKVEKGLWVSFLFSTIVLIIYCSNLDFPTRRKYGVGLSSESAQFVNYIKDLNPSHVYNAPHLAPFLIFSNYPNTKPIIDNRSEAYPSSYILNEYMPSYTKPSTWPQIASLAKVAVFDYSNPFLINWALSKGGWGIGYLNKDVIVLLNKSVYGHRLISVPKPNILFSWAEDSNPRSIMNLENIFMSFGDRENATAVLTRLNNFYPDIYETYYLN